LSGECFGCSAHTDSRGGSSCDQHCGHCQRDCST
jgi:hypothetical protein